MLATSEKLSLATGHTYRFRVQAIDNAGNASALATAVVKIDTTAPVITGASASPSVLSTPNHKMQDVTVGYGASDNNGGATCTLAVSSNEPVIAGGNAPGTSRAKPLSPEGAE